MANVQQTVTAFYPDAEPLLKYSPLTLHLSPLLVLMKTLMLLFQFILILNSTVSNLLLKKLSYPNRRKMTFHDNKMKTKSPKFYIPSHTILLLSKTMGIKRQDRHLFKHYVVGKIHSQDELAFWISFAC